MSSQVSDRRSRVLISAAELAAQTSEARARTVVLDVRFRPDGSDGRQAYLDGHIPGAVFVDLPHDLAGRQQGFSGRRPLPEIRDLERDARRWGIEADSAVVVYDDNYGQQAARAWWVLRWAGLANVRLLDGGFAAWRRAGLPVETAVPLPARGGATLSAGHLPTLDADQAAALPARGLLLDARDRASYEGRPPAPGVAPEGHIPGALSVPTKGNLDEQGLFLSDDALRERFAALRIEAGASRPPLGVYCGGGVTAAHEILALEIVGVDASLFVGSWSAWSSDPARPVARGAEPA